MNSGPGIGSGTPVYASAKMRHIVELARRAGESDAKVLITGESGVGKDLLAREAHACSHRRNRPYIAVNCAGFVETLLESELFGHARGSFTGADRNRIGKIQMADGGTLFLDEVGEMSLRMQAALLRFLENALIERKPAQLPVDEILRIAKTVAEGLDNLRNSGRIALLLGAGFRHLSTSTSSAHLQRAPSQAEAVKDGCLMSSAAAA